MAQQVRLAVSADQTLSRHKILCNAVHLILANVPEQVLPAVQGNCCNVASLVPQLTLRLLYLGRQVNQGESWLDLLSASLD